MGTLFMDFDIQEPNDAKMQVVSEPFCIQAKHLKRLMLHVWQNNIT